MLNEDQAVHLVDTYADRILRISYPYLKQTCDAEDICQTVFLKYLTHGLQFDSPEHEKAWIIRTAIDACKDHLRSGACAHGGGRLDPEMDPDRHRRHFVRGAPCPHLAGVVLKDDTIVPCPGYGSGFGEIAKNIHTQNTDIQAVAFYSMEAENDRPYDIVPIR